MKFTMKRQAQNPDLLRHFLMLMAWVLLAAMSLPAAAAVLRLDCVAVHDTAGYVSRLDDPTGRLSASQAADAPGWSGMPGSLNAGFTSAAVWLRLTVAVGNTPPEGWVLKLGNPLLDDARVYLRVGQDWTQLGHSGEDVPRADWPVDYRSPAFQFSPPGPGQYELLWRVQSKNALATRLTVWERLAFDNASRREGLLSGMYAGFYLLLIGLHTAFWLWTRAPMSGLFLAYIGSCVLNEVLSLGLIQQLSGLPVAWSDRMLGVGIALSLPIGVTMAVRQLGLDRCFPRTARWILRACWAVAGVGALLILSGRYAAGIQPVQMLALAMIFVLIGFASYLLLRGWRPARYFVPVFGVFYAGVLVSFLRNLTLLPTYAFTEHASLLGTMVHMLLLSIIIIGSHERLRRERERQQANAAADLARQHSLKLEEEVGQRTADLSREITRREGVEEDLRQALATERKVLAEQRDFVAMVSHEFRTPLAIIGTSAQQLGRHLDAPAEKSQARCVNIREASQRLLALVDEYLTEDRIREPRAELHDAPCDLPAMLADLAQAGAPGRIVCDVAPAGLSLHSDEGLLRIALRNLLANAERHAPLDDVVRVVARRVGHAVSIDVSNSGPAIARDEQDRLFQKYYRGQNARLKPGAGLGLYLVSQIAARLGGSVALVQAGGTEPVTFRLQLRDRQAG